VKAESLGREFRVFGAWQVVSNVKRRRSRKAKDGSTRKLVVGFTKKYLGKLKT
jgi:hypothetical protein